MAQNLFVPEVENLLHKTVYATLTQYQIFDYSFNQVTKKIFSVVVYVVTGIDLLFLQHKFNHDSSLVY